MRVVIFGGAGFLGKNISLYLAKCGYDVIVFDRVDSPKFSKSIGYFKGNFSDTEKAAEVIREGDCILHLSWNSVPADGNSNIISCLNDDVISSVRFFQKCVEKKVSKIIFLSSGGAIYGIPQYLPIDEKHITAPTTAYGINKFTVEKYLELITSKTDTKAFVIRLANIYGAFQRPFTRQGVVASFLASVLLDKSINIWGDGSAVRDYIYVDDLSRLIALISDYNGDSAVYNVGSGVGCSVNDIIDVVEKVTGKTVEKTYSPSYAGDVGKNVLDCSKAFSELGWKAQVSLDEGIKKMLDIWNPETEQFDKVEF